MNARENVLSLLKRRGYAWIPCEMLLCPSQYERFVLNTGEEDYHAYFGIPWRRMRALTPDKYSAARYLRYHGGALPEGARIDMWGVMYQNTPSSMHMNRMFCPLKRADSIEEIEAYPLPSFNDIDEAEVKIEADNIKRAGCAALAGMACTLWEVPWHIRGMENLMMDMLSGEDMALKLMDRITALTENYARIYARAGADIILLGDDVGMQRTLMMSEDMYVEWLKPRLKRVIAAAKRENPDIVFMYHTCGYVEPLIKHFVEAGIDVLNPVQPECMDFERVYSNFAGALSFNGTLGTQTTLPFGTPADVRACVTRNLDIAGKYGGLFPSPTHMVEPEVPWENILAYADACAEYA